MIEKGTLKKFFRMPRADWKPENLPVANRLIVSEVIFYDEFSPLLLGIGSG